MTKETYVEQQVTQWETRQTEPITEIKRKKIVEAFEHEYDYLKGEQDYWNAEEGRVLRDSNRYHDDV